MEYSKIINKLTEHATSDPGRALCQALMPLTDEVEIEHAQEQTSAALSYLFRKGSISFGSNRNFNDAFKALAIGSSLTTVELLQLASFLDNVARVRNYGRNDATGAPEEEREGDILFDDFDCLSPCTRIAQEINACILSEDRIADDASPELKKVRRSMTVVDDRIHAQLNKMVNTSFSAYLQDNVITMRGDRYCLPIKAEYKSQVPGLVHDQSSTGSTLFIEPASIVSLGNDLRELALAEHKEEEKVLAALSLKAGEHLMEFRDNARIMTQLDFYFAKASLALDWNATRPIFNHDHRIVLHKGRHPLIDPKRVVPIDFAMGDTYDMVVITGPNTGGKTVTLKTVGLFELMGMAGLHIPAGDRSELSLFHEVFADIGDEQSIEQNLSTFSAHMTTTVEILKKADRNCLCLFDELGAGTDPTEGAALAISILNFLHTRGIRTIATTHYSELKVYAMNTEGVENACCEFDIETLQPTYHLLLGIPGRSNAFAISKKLGLPGYIIETAKEQIDQETLNFEDLLSELEETRKEAGKERDQVAALSRSLKKREAILKDKEDKLKEKQDKILAAANEQARDILAEAKKNADEAIAELRRNGRIGDTKALEKTRSALREQVTNKNSALQRKSSAPSIAKVKPESLQVGDRVKIASSGLTGTVSTLPDKSGKLFVQCGIMRSQTTVEDLILVAEDAAGNVISGKSGSSLKRAFANADHATKGGMDFSRATSISPEINLLGLTTDEAIYRLDKYLDDARMSHLSSVRVVHGKGTGALRNAVSNYLRKLKWIKSYRAGDFGEGDAGVTIVTLKD